MNGKLKLNLDDLQVESFHTTPDISSGTGTAFGLASAPDVCPCVETEDPSWDPCTATSPVGDCYTQDGCTGPTHAPDYCYTGQWSGCEPTALPNGC
jgi:hypothetical protein